MKRLMLATLLLLPMLVNAEDAVQVDGVITPKVQLEPFLMFQHQSDILRGPPLIPWDIRPEPTNDYVAVGVTVRWRKVEIDLSHGRKAIDCDLNHGCPSESGTQVAVRWYPLRKR